MPISTIEYWVVICDYCGKTRYGRSKHEITNTVQEQGWLASDKQVKCESCQERQ